MIRDPLTMLHYEMQRRGDLAALAAQVDDLSEDAIRAHPVAMRWMHDALIALKNANRRKAMEAAVSDWAVDGRLADPIGVMRRWNGVDSYVRVGRTELAIKTGQLLWLDANGLWIDTIFTRHVDPKLSTNTTFFRKATRSEYYAMLRTGKQTVETATLTPGMTSVSSFQIFRPG